MNRAGALRRLSAETFDVLIIGGGATGLGCALDAAARGYRTGLIEAYDFAKGTSSRSTKLVHGGVRYLQQGNIALVKEALRERARLHRNAPHLVQELRFVVPAYNALELGYLWAGLKLYDALAGKSPFRRSSALSVRDAVAHIGTLNPHRLKGAVAYSDAQFDDARLAIALAQTAHERGAAVANYVRADGLRAASAGLRAVDATDTETGERFTIRAKAIVNAAGIFADAVRRMDDPAAKPLLTFSRGSHIVLPAHVLGGSQNALLVPKTADGRVLFAIPWHGFTLAGTTDVASGEAEIEPRSTGEEIAFILGALNAYLAHPAAENDVLSTWAGLRPLLDRSATGTAQLSREHAIEISRSGLVTITGGKWTTYRKMAEDAVDAAASSANLALAPSPTADLPLSQSDAPHALPAADRVPYYAREEMARTVEDILARRTRTLFVDAQSAAEQAPGVAAALAQELGRGAAWQSDQVRDFNALARAYLQK
ncbi:MAG TPA: glycerol-3-phosphate dehydrogenase/oxidase [Candidatus Baltobacteraceae bacterium]|nr:glycerol-3-phosphate dehydrogenase/oxidase [Candidatus Baltobacteraceae bacterium]